jgi:hypothetical protein
MRIPYLPVIVVASALSLASANAMPGLGRETGRFIRADEPTPKGVQTFEPAKSTWPDLGVTEHIWEPESGIGFVFATPLHPPYRATVVFATPLHPPYRATVVFATPLHPPYRATVVFATPLHPPYRATVVFATPLHPPYQAI